MLSEYNDVKQHRNNIMSNQIKKSNNITLIHPTFESPCMRLLLWLIYSNYYNNLHIFITRTNKCIIII